MKYKGVKAFTLAEVLITLAVVGVVAALTLPLVVANYKKNQYIESLKKAYAQFNQVLVSIANDHGCPNDLKCTGLFSPPNTNNVAFGDEVVKYIKPMKVCRLEANQGCWAATMNANFDGSSGTNYQYDASVISYKFLAQNGVSYFITNFTSNCTHAQTSTNNVTGNMSQVCARVFIDVNGPKKGPNYIGRDIFTFWITNGKGAVLYPTGGADDRYNNTQYWWKGWNPNCCTTQAPVGGTARQGIFCSGRIMEEGWKMNY